MFRPFVELDAVSKSFTPGVFALEDVSMAFRKGEIHAILGENGAGKSTLLNILFGMHQPSAGGILLNGREVRHASPADAIANGLGMVHQHFKLVPSFTVGQNLRLAAKPTKRKTLRRDADIRRIAAEFGLPLDPAALAGTLPLSIQQRVEILKALVNEAELILFDEPTTILNPSEIDAFYAVLRRIAESGRAVIVVTHHLDEVIDHADHVSVIRRGRLVSSGPVAAKRREDLILEIVGRAMDQAPLRVADALPGGTVIALDGVSVAPSPSSSGLDGATFDLRCGEIVGIAGVEGNGQRELFEVLAGLRAPDRGTVRFRAKHPDGRPKLGLVPEDRHQEGLVLDLPISLNLLLGRIGQAPFARAGALQRVVITTYAERMRAEADIRTTSVEATPRTLSGGNQQKIVLARAMSEDAPAIVVYQPTRGLDVAASEEVLRRLRRAADEDGKAVLMISSNLDEILRVCDRIVVLYAGRTVGDLGHPASREAIGELMTSGTDSRMAAA